MYCFLLLATDAESRQLAHVFTSEGNILQLYSHISQKNISVFTFIEVKYTPCHERFFIHLQSSLQLVCRAHHTSSNTSTTNVVWAEFFNSHEYELENNIQSLMLTRARFVAHFQQPAIQKESRKNSSFLFPHWLLACRRALVTFNFSSLFCDRGITISRRKVAHLLFVGLNKRQG